MLFLCYKNSNIKYLASHFKPPIQKKNSCMRSMPMFVCVTIISALSHSFCKTVKICYGRARSYSRIYPGQGYMPIHG